MKIHEAIEMNGDKNTDNLLYVGKSNKKFTYNRIYRFLQYDGFMYIVHDNRGVKRVIRDMDYFERVFKIVTNKELIKMNRKLKLNKINEKK